jgi:hypothetical protein
MVPSNHARAVRYRQLALGEPDRARADLLYKIADEADRNVLCTSDWLLPGRPPEFLIFKAGDR